MYFPYIEYREKILQFGSIYKLPCLLPLWQIFIQKKDVNVRASQHYLIGSISSQAEVSIKGQ